MNHSTLSQLYTKLTGCHISDSTVNVLYYDLLSTKGVSMQVQKYPQQIFASAFKQDNDSSRFYAIDTVSLRNVLQTRSLFNNGPIVAYNFNFVKKYLRQYPIILKISTDCDFNKFQGFSISDKYQLDISKKLKKLYINTTCISQQQYQSIQRIMKQYAGLIDYGFISQFNAFIPQASVISTSIIKVSSAPFAVGDVVRFRNNGRNNGIVFKQIHGRIVQIDTKNIKVIWSDGKVSKFDISHPQYIYRTIQKIS